MEISFSIHEMYDLYISTDLTESLDVLLKMIAWEGAYLVDKYSVCIDSELQKWMRCETDDFDPFEFKDYPTLMSMAIHGGELLKAKHPEFTRNVCYDFSSFIKGYFAERIHWRLINLGSKSHLINFDGHIIGYNHKAIISVANSNLWITRSGNFSVATSSNVGKMGKHVHTKLSDVYDIVNVVTNNVHCTLCDLLSTKLLESPTPVDVGIKVVHINREHKLHFTAPVYCSGASHDIKGDMLYKELTDNIISEKYYSTELFPKDVTESQFREIIHTIRSSKYILYNTEAINLRTGFELGVAYHSVEPIKCRREKSRYILVDKEIIDIPQITEPTIIDIDDVSTAFLMGYYCDSDIPIYYSTKLNNKFVNYLPNFIKITNLFGKYIGSDHKPLDSNIPVIDNFSIMKLFRPLNYDNFLVTGA